MPLLLLAAAACGGSPDTPAPEPTPTSATLGTDWIVLFDGTSMDAFRGFDQDGMAPGWEIVDGALHQARPSGEGDIVTRERFRDFDLEFEWRLEAGGNSGVMFRVSEDHDHPWVTGPEYQLLDNDGHPDRLEGPDRMAGANYDVHPTDPAAVRPVGEWNSGRILVQGTHVEHWLNGVKVVEYELMTPDWDAAVAASKWADNPDYGREPEGHIAFQGDHEPVWLRNIRIKPL